MPRPKFIHCDLVGGPRDGEQTSVCPTVDTLVIPVNASDFGDQPRMRYCRYGRRDKASFSFIGYQKDGRI